MNGHPSGATRGTESGLQAIRAYHLFCGYDFRATLRRVNSRGWRSHDSGCCQGTHRGYPMWVFSLGGNDGAGVPPLAFVGQRLNTAPINHDILSPLLRDIPELKQRLTCK